MSRHREFDLEEVLDAAVEACWCGGYAGTSFGELERRTGVHKGSLYRVWPDKLSLFLAALDRYQGRELERLRHELRPGRDPRAALRDWLLRLALRCTGEEARRGCLSVNTLVELAPHEPRVARRLTEQRRAVEGLLVECLRRRDPGESEPEELARLLLLFAYGLRSTKGQLEADEARRVVELTLDRLGLRPVGTDEA